MRPRRVAVTGLGIVTPIGVGKDDYWASLKAGRSGLGPLRAFDASAYKSRVSAEVKDFQVEDYLGPDLAKQWTQQTDRANQFLLVSAQEALNDAGLELECEDPYRVGVTIGSAGGDLESRVAFLDDLFTSAANGDQVAFHQAARQSLDTFFGRPAINLSGFIETRGESVATSSACASSTDALGYAFRQVQYGEADVLVSGGTEAPIQPFIFYSLSLLDALSQHNDEPARASRPYDRTRNGFVIGEGGGAIILEEWEHARQRGAHIYAEIMGFGMTSDAYHFTAPNPSNEQLARAMHLALDEAGITPAEVDYVCAHGTSTVLNDVNETKTIKNVFGQDAYRVPISAIKSMLGHPQGAAGIMQAVACALVLEHGFVPPTINYRDPDPECDLDYVPNVGRPLAVGVILQNTLSFFGRNSVLIYKKPVTRAI